MDRLHAAGLLYTRSTPRGALPLPNLARDRGCDLVLVNMPPPEMPRFFEAAGTAGIGFDRVY
jgi:hypothetical protein